MSETAPAFRSYPSVQKFVEDLATKDMPAADIEERVALLQDFCQFVWRTPDQMIEEVFDMETRKYKKRNFYTAKVEEFSAQISGTWQVRTARGNVIRNFFIANGRRLPNAQPDWL
jgi:hypothetical protein